MSELTRPPLGVQPRPFWLLDRARDLARAIHEQYAQGFEGQLDHERINEWINELQQVEYELSAKP